MQRSKDHECLLSFKFFHVQTSTKGFHELFLIEVLDVRWCDVHCMNRSSSLQSPNCSQQYLCDISYWFSGLIPVSLLFSEVFASQVLKYLLQFSGEYFTFLSFFVFSVAFFSGCFPQHCIDIVLFLHCSYSLEIWFAHITVLSSILRHFGSLCYIPKDPSLFPVSYFPLVLSVLRCLNANNVLDMTAYF